MAESDRSIDARIGEISAPPTDLPDVPDENTRREQRELEIERLREQTRSLSEDREARAKYAGRIFYLIAIWLASVFGIVLCQGFGSVQGWFGLSDKVLITLIGGTTINVLGLFIIVLNYLFHSSASDKSKRWLPGIFPARQDGSARH